MPANPDSRASPTAATHFPNPALAEAASSASPFAGPPRNIHDVTGWITDVFRLGWGALSWNTRKSWHRLCGRGNQAPCQVSSDSGRAHETGCEAITPFRSPGTFRVVCPLLRQRADGAWVCSVDSAQVRPFWGRALVLLTGGGLVAYLSATLVAWAFSSLLGYHADYRQIAWPAAWHELRVVQARRFLEKSQEARAAGQPAEALLALSNAYELNPADYGTGLLLGQLWQGGQPLLSDGVFARLYRDHPERREQTAQTWYRALLARGDFAAVLPLARNRILAPDHATPAPGWAQAFLFAARRAENPDALADLLKAPRLPESLRALFSLELSLPSQPSARRVQTLVDAIPGERDPFIATHLLRRLLEEKRPDLVLTFVARPESPLGDRDKARLRLDALADLGRSADRAALVRQILALPANPAIWELLSAHLIARPDLALLHDVAEAHARDPLPPSEANYPQLLAWFAACGVNRDPEALHAAAQKLVTAAARDSRPLTIASETFLNARSTFRLETVLPLLQPLPLETVYALYDHYQPPRPFSD